MPLTQENEQGIAPVAMSSTLYLVATPIGNLKDITLRALEVLRSVDWIAAEDTRHSRKLLSHYEIHKPVVSYHSHNMKQRGPELIARLREGFSVALVTDAGSPGISDPGADLTREAIDAGLRVEALPGPTALITALVLSGLPTHPFAFLGFPPARGAGRQRFFRQYARLPMTCILYESPTRLQRTLADIQSAWGSRFVAVARELTKRFEEVFRGTIPQAGAHFSEGLKGELTLVVEGATDTGLVTPSEEHWRGSLHTMIVRDGLRVREAVDQVVREYGVSRKTVYEEALRVKSPRDH